MEGRGQFTFYRSFYEAVRDLPDWDRLGVYEKIIAYALDQKDPENLEGVQKTAFILVRPVLDASLKKAVAGKLGGSKPKANRKQNESKGEKEEEKENETENETENEIENEIETETEDECLWPAGFREFWDLYPVKLGKDAAVDAWQRRKPDPDAICDGVRKWLQTQQWIREQGRFIPRAAKFIEERYDEHLPGDHIPVGASGALGKAELEAIEMILRDQ